MWMDGIVFMKRVERVFHFRFSVVCSGVWERKRHAYTHTVETVHRPGAIQQEEHPALGLSAIAAPGGPLWERVLGRLSAAAEDEPLARHAIHCVFCCCDGVLVLKGNEETPRMFSSTSTNASGS